MGLAFCLAEADFAAADLDFLEAEFGLVFGFTEAEADFDFFAALADDLALGLVVDFTFTLGLVVDLALDSVLVFDLPLADTFAFAAVAADLAFAFGLVSDFLLAGFFRFPFAFR